MKNKKEEYGGIKLLENTPVVINIYGVTGTTVGIDNYDKLKTICTKLLTASR